MKLSHLSVRLSITTASRAPERASGRICRGCKTPLDPRTLRKPHSHLRAATRRLSYPADVTTVDLSDRSEVADALAEYLSSRVGFAGYAEAPAPIGRGFDSFIYAFRISPRPDLEPAWDGRLVAKIYGARERAATVRRERTAQQFVASRGYPALLPLVAEDCAPGLGLPLVVMKYAGESVFDLVRHRPWRVRSLLEEVGELQARLHALPLDGCPIETVVRIEEQMEAVRAYLARTAPRRFDHELDWLDARGGRLPEAAPSLLHNDFHPLNVLVAGDGARSVIDWTDAMVGDRHYDVGRTLALLWFAKIAATDRSERLALLLLRGFMRRRHMRGYERRLPLDRLSLHYWETFHTLRSGAQLIELANGDGSQLTEMAKSLDARLIDEAHRRVETLIARAPALRSA